MSDKKYLAMRQVYELARDENGENIYDERPNPWYREGFHRPDQRTSKFPRQQKAEGKFRAFGANGKVVSLYDSPAKARRYCGKDGYVAEMDPADCRRVDCTPEEQMAHCENRMLFWAAEADRLQKEIRANGLGY